MNIINFHGVGEPQRSLDPGEQPFWLDVRQFRDILDRVANHPDRRHLEITFDDGNISDVNVALPELKARGLSATFFVLTGRLGRKGSLSQRDVRTLMDNGMAIGSHGPDHADLTTLPPHQIAGDLRRSRRILEDCTGCALRDFAIPFGRYNAGALRGIREAGFARAYTSDGGRARESAFLQPRRSLRSDMSEKEISAALNGHVAPLKRLRRMVGMGLKRFQ